MARQRVAGVEQASVVVKVGKMVEVVVVEVVEGVGERAGVPLLVMPLVRPARAV